MAETFSAKAAADLSAVQYHIMRLSAANTVNVASLTTVTGICGVLQNKPQSGEAGAIAYLGQGRVGAGGAITAGVHVTCNGSGRAATANSGDMIVGQALEAAGADGDIIDVLYKPPVKWFGTNS